MRLLLVAFASATVGTAGVGLTAVDAARNRALALQAEQADPGAHRSSAVNASSAGKEGMDDPFSVDPFAAEVNVSQGDLVASTGLESPSIAC